jgi:hypothetical protein
MTDKDRKKGSPLSDETVERMKEEIIHGVGYGRPPVHSRFQKGTSGNVKGRPRSAPDPNLMISDLPTVSAILKGAQQKVKMRDGDKIAEVPFREGLVRAMQASALKGDSRAQRLLLQELRSAEERQAIEVQNDREWAREYKAFAHRAIEEARAAGEPPPQILPHPDDIVIDNEVGLRFVGPIDEEGQRKLEETLRFRDLLIMQDELDQRLWPHANKAPGSLSERGRVGGAFLFASALDRTVPERYRLSDHELILRTIRYEGMSKRTLLKELYNGWRALGRNVPRGSTFASFERTKEMLAFTYDLVTASNDGRVELEGARRGEPDSKTQRFFHSWIERINAAPR